MTTLAAQMTAKQPGAIAAICIFGPDAAEIIASIFKPRNPASTLQPANIVTGTIIENETIIDEVVVTSENNDLFFINCHDNSLIIEKICRLLAGHGAKLVYYQELLANRFQSSHAGAIEIEAELAMLQAKTIDGYKLIKNQLAFGLGPILKELLASADLESIHRIAHKVLEDSIPADKIINGCRIVIAGPPNSGKSTLLNQLCSRPVSIVSETAGTTRDYVTDTCVLGPLAAEFIDTAGLDRSLAEADKIDRQAQDFSKKMLETADLVIFLSDARNPQIPPSELAQKKILPVLNKIDLLPNPPDTTGILQISAKSGFGLDKLIQAIHDRLQTGSFDLKTPICFRPRQQGLFTRLLKCRNLDEAKHIIRELLNGPIPL